MENRHDDQTTDNNFDRSHEPTEIGKGLSSSQDPVPGNQSFRHENLTTGSGYSEAERSAQDATNNPSVIDHRGSDELAQKYNFNDKAHFDSSKDDFVPTVSSFRHADENAENRDNPETPGTL